VGKQSASKGLPEDLAALLSTHSSRISTGLLETWAEVTEEALIQVAQRGAKAWPGRMTAGMGRPEWAKARVEAFLSLAADGERPHPYYTGDDDLLHDEHPAVKHLPGFHDQSDHGNRTRVTLPDGTVRQFTSAAHVDFVPYVEGPPESVADIVRKAGGLRAMAREEMAVIARMIADLLGGAGVGALGMGEKARASVTDDPLVAEVLAELTSMAKQELDLLDPDVFNGLVQRFQQRLHDGKKHLPGLHDQRLHGSHAHVVNPDGSITAYTSTASIRVVPYTLGAPPAVREMSRGRRLREFAREEIAVLAATLADLLRAGYEDHPHVGSARAGFDAGDPGITEGSGRYMKSSVADDPLVAAVLAELESMSKQDLDLFDDEVFNALMQRLQQSEAFAALDVESKAKKFDSDKHPRGKDGRFISIGALVDLPDGVGGAGGTQRGKVVGEDAKKGTITVAKRDGSKVTVPAKDVDVVRAPKGKEKDDKYAGDGTTKPRAADSTDDPPAKKPQADKKPAGDKTPKGDAPEGDLADMSDADLEKEQRRRSDDARMLIQQDRGVGNATFEENAQRMADIRAEQQRRAGGDGGDGERAEISDADLEDDADFDYRVKVDDSDADYADDSPAKADKNPDGNAWGEGYPDGDPRLGDPGYDRFTADLDWRLTAALGLHTRNGKQEGTKSLHTIEGTDGAYTAERRALHRRIVEAEIAKVEAAGIPKDRKAVIMAGPPGAGKSTLIKTQGAEFGVESDAKGNPTNYAVVNADDMKEAIVNAGLPADYERFGFQPDETASLTHEESSDLAKALQARLLQEGYNVILDGTFTGKPEKNKVKVSAFANAGYEVRGVLIDGEVATSLTRAGQRHRGRDEDGSPRTGPPFGGRYVPLRFVASNGATGQYGDSAVFGRPHKNNSSENFEAAQEVFANGAYWYDNSEGEATLVHSINTDAAGAQSITGGDEARARSTAGNNGESVKTALTYMVKAMADPSTANTKGVGVTMDTTALRTALLEAKKAGSGTATALLDENPRLAHAEYGEVERKAAGATGIVATDDKTGLVEAIVSVTGIVDEVDDVILPGAYATTLKTRTPKGVWSHDWDHWVARTEEVVELLPGDPRLPQKTRAGDAWPKEAGALLVKARFNLDTQAGKDAYSNVCFFADECEWSIGYNVQQGKSSRDAAGRRLIKQIDLFEYSPVLFGAMPLASTLAVKGREMALETKDAPAAAAAAVQEVATAEGVQPDEVLDTTVEGDTPPTDAATTDATADATGDTAPPAADAAAGDETPPIDETDPPIEAETDPEYTLSDSDRADLEALDVGAVEIDDDDVALVNLLREDAEAAGAGTKGSSASLNESPKKNWVENAGDLPRYIREIARSIREKRGLPLSQAIPIAIAQIKKWAAGGDNVKADTRAKAAKALAEWEALKAKNRARMAKPGKKTASGYDPAVETGETAGTKAVQRTVEVKEYPYVAGSHEERREALRAALDEKFKPQRVSHEGSDTRPADVWVEMVATFDDHVIVRVHDWGESSNANDETWWIDYSWDNGGQVLLGEPRDVKIDVTVDVHDPSLTPDPYVESVEGEFIGAAAKALVLCAESKAGRVLSTANAERLRQAYEHLGAVLAAAGVEVGPAARDDDGADSTATPDTTAPSIVGNVAVKDGEPAEGETKTGETDGATATIDLAEIMQAKSLAAYVETV
jgi:HK97 family phage prohead protease